MYFNLLLFEIVGKNLLFVDEKLSLECIVWEYMVFEIIKEGINDSEWMNKINHDDQSQ